MDRRQHREANLQDIQHGWDVYDADDQKVGKVDAIEDGYILAHKGIFFPTDLYIPASAVDRVAEDRVYLNVAKDEVDDQRWDSPPSGRLTGRETTTDTAGTVAAPRGAATERRGAERMDSAAAERQAPARDAAGQQSLYLHEEQLSANKERVQAGEVRVGKEVVEEQRTVEVPVTREEVYIDRRPGDRRPDDHPIGQDAGEGAIRVPVSEERVNVEKVPVMTEEVRVGTRQVQETKQVTDTVKREEARIEESGDVRVEGTDRASRSRPERR